MPVMCYIYRCSAKQDMYIYLASKDDFDSIDQALQKKLGYLSFSMELELDKDTKLAKEDPEKVINSLQTQGFHLQLPAETSIEDLLTQISSHNKS